MCREDGGTIDDVIVYRLAPDRFMMVTNAANTAGDWQHITERLPDLPGRVTVTDSSKDTALLAVQGPKSLDVVGPLAAASAAELRPFGAVCTRVGGVESLLSRTGYTGEDGFEIYCQVNDGQQLWDELMTAGEASDMAPAGLGARDTLRLEAGFLLYGNELSADRSPLAAGLGFAVRFDKGPFIGRSALLQEQETGSDQHLIRFVMEERGIPRTGYDIIIDGKAAGTVTSGSYAPSLDPSIGMGYAAADIDVDQIGIDIRGTVKTARVVQGRFA